MRALLPWLVVVAGEAAVLVASYAPRAVWVPVAAVTLLLLLAHVLVMPRARFRFHRWERTEAAFYTQSGWLTVERRLAPLTRVQTVDVERGPLESLFRLATLTVTTASAAGALRVPALDRGVADALAEDLGVLAGATADDAT